MEGREGSRSWIWMAVFTPVFVVIGVTDLLGREVLSGAGFVICGVGSALVAVGDYRDQGRTGGGRPWRVLGAVISLVGIGLLGLAVFG